MLAPFTLTDSAIQRQIAEAQAARELRATERAQEKAARREARARDRAEKRAAAASTRRARKAKHQKISSPEAGATTPSATTNTVCSNSGGRKGTPPLSTKAQRTRTPNATVSFATRPYGGMGAGSAAPTSGGSGASGGGTSVTFARRVAERQQLRQHHSPRRELSPRRDTPTPSLPRRGLISGGDDVTTPEVTLDTTPQDNYSTTIRTRLVENGQGGDRGELISSPTKGSSDKEKTSEMSARTSTDQAASTPATPLVESPFPRPAATGDDTSLPRSEISQMSPDEIPSVVSSSPSGRNKPLIPRLPLHMITDTDRGTGEALK